MLDYVHTSTVDGMRRLLNKSMTIESTFGQTQVSLRCITLLFASASMQLQMYPRLTAFNVQFGAKYRAGQTITLKNLYWKQMDIGYRRATKYSRLHFFILLTLLCSCSLRALTLMKPPASEGS